MKMMPPLNPEILSIPEAASIFINQLVYDKKSKGEKVYTYSLGEAYFEIPKYEISDLEFQKGYHYSSSRGQQRLREKICWMYKKRHNVDIDPNSQILISCGSKVVIYMLMKTVLTHGDEVLVHEPAWLSYKEQITLAGGTYKGIPFDVGVWQWERYITNRTKVIIINNPNNPSGQLYTHNELEQLVKYAEKYNLYILSDEAYSDFLLRENKFLSLANIDTLKHHSLVVNSLSKNMGMSGWRVGYAISNSAVIDQLLKINQHLITCAPTVLQDYMAEHFEEILEITLPQAREMAKKRQIVQRFMNQIGLEILDGVGTFYFMINVSEYPGTTKELVYELLLNHNIATVPGEAYGESTAGFIRFGIGVESLEDINDSLKVIKSYLGNGS